MRVVSDVIATGLREHRVRFDLRGHLGPEIVHSLRAMRRAPGYCAAVIGTIALGIGSVSAVFTLADPLIFKPLPYVDADRIVAFNVTGPNAYYPMFGDLVTIRDRSQALDDLSTAATTGLSAFRDGTDMTHGVVTDNFLHLLGARTIAGRLFRPDEYPQAPKDKPGVVLLTWGYWQRAFGGRDDIV
jgi:putative ABC transport system permease protein